MKKDYFISAFVGLVLICMAQGLWQVSFAQEKADKKGKSKETNVQIKEEKGPLGHKTIGIDEESLDLDAVKEIPLTFSTLMTWEYEVGENPSPPETIKKLDGRKVRLTGFMYPLQEGKSIQYFCLLRTTQTCCYGPRPQYNQYVFVEMEKATDFYRLDPVSCVGKFRVDPAPDEGFIYRMEGKTCEPVGKK
jgi:hypothetical protein